MQSETQSSDFGANGHGGDGDPVPSQMTHSVPSEIRHFFADVEDLINSFTSLTGEDQESAKAQLLERVNAAKESMENIGGGLAHRARKTVKVTNDYVHEEPWRFIGAGVTVGFLLGLALARRG